MTTTLAAPAGTDPSAPPAARGAGGAVLRWAVVGTVLLALALVVDLQRLGGNPLGLVQPGGDGPSVEVFAEDFPDVELPSGLGLDGQMTYAMARDPWPVDASADALDRPRYRLQRPLLSWVAGTAYPGTGGMGLVWTIVLVNLLCVAAGAWAVGRLSTRWGGPAWIAAVFPILPGCFMGVRVSTADAAAIGLALLAVALAQDRRTGAAVAVGVAAVLTKEPALLVLVGWALAHRTRRDVAVAAVPFVALVGWMATLRVLVPGAESLNGDIGLPGLGIAAAARDLWVHGDESWGMIATVAGLVLGVAALGRGRLGHPLGWAVVVNLAYLLVAGSNPVGTSFGGTRTALGLTAVSLLVLATPRAPRVQALPAALRGVVRPAAPAP